MELIHTMEWQVYKQQGNIGLFDFDENMSKLNKIGNPLTKLSQVVDFEKFRGTLGKTDCCGRR